ncbi:hypothetical protein GCM10009717_30740 [Agromyces allii]|uniref:Uncharacterized protein n=1 Tax=Agromyces allii TaxID=393607 RepID=A0ABN2R1Q4_9MICO
MRVTAPAARSFCTGAAVLVGDADADGDGEPPAESHGGAEHPDTSNAAAEITPTAAMRVTDM